MTYQYLAKMILLTHPEDLQGGEKVRMLKGEFEEIESEFLLTCYL
jgi:hypothetical protein